MYCDALFVHFFPFLGVILISCHSLVLFHCKHYCAKCTVFKRMWMCIVSEPNKYNDVKPYFSIPVGIFLSFVSGKVVLMKLFALCPLEIPKFQNLDRALAFLLSFANVQRMQITLSAYSPCQSLSASLLCFWDCPPEGWTGTCVDQRWLRAVGTGLPRSAGTRANKVRQHLRAPLFGEANAESPCSWCPVKPLQNSVSDLLLRISDSQPESPLQGADWLVGLHAKLLLSSPTQPVPVAIVVTSQRCVPPSVRDSFAATPVILYWFREALPLLSSAQVFKEHSKLENIHQKFQWTKIPCFLRVTEMTAVLLCVILRQWDGLTSQSTKSLLHKLSSDFGVYIILKVLSSQSFPLSATSPAYLKIQAWTSDLPQEEGCIYHIFPCLVRQLFLSQ